LQFPSGRIANVS